MIYIAKTNAEENEFIALLEKSRELMLMSRGRENVTPAHFETIVFDRMTEAAKGTTFEGTVKQTGVYAFPDIIAKKYFGVEVKMTTSDHWTSTGNSVLESSRIEAVERIYIMFGKFGGKFDVRYRLYQECLPEVSVTHSPRYRINMDLPLGQSIFDKIGVAYDKLRKDPNPIQKIKDYYRKQLKDGEELWWIDQWSEDRPVSPIIRQFRSLSDKEKESFVAEAMILFPEIFGNSTTKFERAAAYLIAEYNAVSTNMRDHFSAGGKVQLKVKGKTVLVPKLAGHLFDTAKAIKEKIDEIDAQTIAYYWGMDKHAYLIDSRASSKGSLSICETPLREDKIEKDRLSQWKKILDNKFALVESKVTASDIFDAGLK